MTWPSVELKKFLVIKGIPITMDDLCLQQLIALTGSFKIYPVYSNNQFRTVVVEYLNFEESNIALLSLHQLELSGNPLNVEYLKKKELLKKYIGTDKENNILQKNSVIDYKDVERKRKYLYPELNKIILENIVDTLINNKNFYFKVLHLMNSLNLPTPFIKRANDPQELNTFYINDNDCSVTDDHMMKSTKDEEKDKITYRYSFTNKLNSYKRCSLIQEIHNRKPKFYTEIKDCFSLNNSSIERNKNIPIKFHNASKISTETLSTNTFCNNENQLKTEASTDDFGFGIINKTSNNPNYPIITTKSIDSTITSIENFQPIPLEDIKNNRLSIEEIIKNGIIKTYSTGTPSCSLYIKNLVDSVTDYDIYRLFGSFLIGLDDQKRQMFHVQLLKRGKMRGQAFVSFPSVDIAQKALVNTNGYVLFDKPVILQFSRSQK